MTSGEPGLYLHIPFCAAVCPYCDFAVVKASAARRRSFVPALLAEIERVAAEAPSFGAFDTVYFGGGTPSILGEDELGSILERARSRLGVAPGAGVFLEANPEHVSAESLAAWRRLGVSFLSLGVQSFDAAELSFLGRSHSPSQARQAVELALGAGFETVSFDLIYGLPGQSAEAWGENLGTAVALSPQHLSCYQLTVHEGTPFGLRASKGTLTELGEGDQAELFVRTHERLAEAGVPAYEVSNFARFPEHRSAHNQKYWHHVPYLGLGPSAHSFDGESRFWNQANLSAYRAGLERGERPIAGRETLSGEQRALEALMLGLRTVAGIDLEEFHGRFGFDLAAANRVRLEELEAAGWLKVEGRHLALNLRGLAVADSLAAELELEGDPALRPGRGDGRRPRARGDR